MKGKHKYFRISKELAVRLFPKFNTKGMPEDIQLIYIDTGTCPFVDLCYIRNTDIVYLTSKFREETDTETLVEVERKSLV